MDLNLLTALDALLEENSVVGAAERLHLTPPAVSRTLSRIRHVTGDDILVRSGRTMTPTPYALAIRDEVHALVRQAEAMLKPRRRLDLATLERVFTLRGHDALVATLAPGLVSLISAEAPGLRVRFLGEAPVDTPELARGQVDIELGGAEPGLPEIRFEPIASDQVVAVFRLGHALGRGVFTAARFARASHVTVSRRGRLRGPIDDALAAQGLERQVLAALPTTTAALEVAARSDLVVVVPGTLCRPLCAALGLQTRALPAALALEPSRVVMSWHRRHDSDPAHAWLRGHVARLLREAVGA